ncbi:MAG: TolC family protein, partial [Alphaproteobacteria bacterium]|nr:TolC family protein [Alphaproteobacteria bacterium]
IGVQMRIPLWNQNDAERARAHAEDNAARIQNARYQNLSAQDTIRSLHQAALAKAEYLKSLEQNVLPRYRKSYELTRSQVKQGQGSPMELWALREKLYQTEEAAISATTDAYLARLRLEAEIGGKLEEAQ